jgi:pimeloyl-ACP methyl ester carboxylesterase
MKRFLKIFAALIGLLLLVYLFGPKPPKPHLNDSLPVVAENITTIDSFVKHREAGQPVRTDNEARILWANDSLKFQTEYCLLYLHGFSASYFEGYPTNQEFAKRYGCNAYFPRLASHGLVTEDALIDMTPERLWNDAREALAIAHILGKKVVIMSTSTGGTLAMQLAADFPELVDGLILYSPNVRINNGAAFLLSKPWGLQIARKVYKSKYRVTNEDFASKDCQYWYCKYRLEAVVYLQQLVEATMSDEVFAKVKTPVFLGYYYKDETHQDQVVRVDAMLSMFDKLGTPADKKVKEAFPEAGEHVIACELTSGALADVKKATFDFAEKILGLQPK